MSGSTFGRIFRLTTYGESHGPGLGGIVDGCPANIPLDEAVLQNELDKRRPGAGGVSTPRHEMDKAMIFSGVFEGKTTGMPIMFHIVNTNQKNSDYDALRDVYRPGHADFTFDAKFGIRDHRGGGRSSGRETVARVAGGAVAQAFLETLGIRVFACTKALGGLQAPLTDMEHAAQRPFFAPDDAIVPEWKTLVEKTRAARNTLGALVHIEAHGVPAGLGEPVFDKLDAVLAHALMSVGSVKGVSVGAGFDAATMLGSENNDPLAPDGFSTNNAGGILGGISNGQPIVLTVAIKPIPSIGLDQKTVNKHGEPVTVNIGGRHDLAAVPRVVPVLQAMTALVLADAVLLHRRLG